MNSFNVSNEQEKFNSFLFLFRYFMRVFTNKNSSLFYYTVNMKKCPCKYRTVLFPDLDFAPWMETDYTAAPLSEHILSHQTQKSYLRMHRCIELCTLYRQGLQGFLRRHLHWFVCRRRKSWNAMMYKGRELRQSINPSLAGSIVVIIL